MVSRLLRSVWEHQRTTSSSSALSISTSPFRRSATSSPKFPACATSSPRICGTATVRPRSSRGPQYRQGGRDPGRRFAPHRQPLHRGQRRQGPHPRRDGRVPGLPLTRASDFLSAFDELEKVAWYIHHTRKAAITSTAKRTSPSSCRAWPRSAPENQVDDLIRHRLREMFKPGRKAAYEEVLPLPGWKTLPTGSARVASCSSSAQIRKIPPEEVQKILRRPEPEKQPLRSHRRQERRWAASRKPPANSTPPKRPRGASPGAILNAKIWSASTDLRAGLHRHHPEPFRKVLFPIQRAGRPAQLRPKPSNMARDTNKAFNGEDQIEKTLTSNPLKLYLDVEKDFDPVRDKPRISLAGKPGRRPLDGRRRPLR